MQTLAEKFNTAPAKGVFESVLAQSAKTEHHPYLQHLGSGVWEHIGSLIALEYMIGQEMVILEKGLDNTPPIMDRFSKTNPEGRKNRLYVTHHAAHDLDLHFPELMEGAMRDLPKEDGERENALKDIQHGIAKIGEAKKGFYDSLSF